MIYYIEAVLFSRSFAVDILIWANNTFNQKLLSIGMVMLTYKAALDPYLMVINV